MVLYALIKSGFLSDMIALHGSIAKNRQAEPAKGSMYERWKHPCRRVRAVLGWYRTEKAWPGSNPYP